MVDHEVVTPDQEVSQEIGFNLAGDGFNFELATKSSATAVTSVSKIYWEAKTSSGVAHAVAQYDVKSGAVSTGKYWPAEATTYSYMVSNVAFTTNTGVIAATNTTDIVVGTASGVTKTTSCSVTLDHIFSRTGTFTMNTQDGYEISNVSWKIKSSGDKGGTAGNYTIGGSWGNTATTKLSEQAITSSSDLYLIPAPYTITVEYTLTKGEYVESFKKSANVTFVQGKVNNITGTATGGTASDIKFNVTVSDWGTENHNPSFS